MLSTATPLARASMLLLARRRVALRTLGDVPGHEFHGNQWTEGLASFSVDRSVPRSQREKIEKALAFVKKDQPADLLAKVHLFVSPTGKGNTYNPHGYTKRNIVVQNGKPVRDAQGNLTYSGKYTVYISSKQASAADFARTIAHELEHVAQWERGETPHEAGAMAAGNKASHKMRGAAQRPERAVHVAADRHLKPMTLAVRAAFNLGRKAYKSGGVDAAVKAVRSALLKTLPPALLATMKSGGDAALGTLRTAGDVEGHEFHGNQWTSGGGQTKVEVAAVGETHTYALSREATALANSDDFVWEHDLLPSLDGLRPAGFSDGYQARRAGAADRINRLAKEHGVTKGFAVEVGSRRGIVTVDRARVNDKDYPDFLKAVKDYLSGNGLSVAQEKTMGKWLGFSKKSTAAHLARKSKWDAGRSAQLRTLRPQVKGEPHSQQPPFNLAFNVEDPRAVEWAQNHALELADGISETTKEALRAAIADALEGDGIDAAYDAILAAVGDDARAETIARTEIMTAANEGQREGWLQAQDEGLLPADAKVVWIATAGACPECEDLDGATRDLSGEYDDPDAGDGPPLHPNCRCTEGIA